MKKYFLFNLLLILVLLPDFVLASNDFKESKVLVLEPCDKRAGAVLGLIRKKIQQLIYIRNQFCIQI